MSGNVDSELERATEEYCGVLLPSMEDSGVPYFWSHAQMENGAQYELLVLRSGEVLTQEVMQLILSILGAGEIESKRGVDYGSGN